jgi:hypothetical protein
VDDTEVENKVRRIDSLKAANIDRGLNAAVEGVIAEEYHNTFYTFSIHIIELSAYKH